VNLFSGQPADPPSEDFIMRNAMDAQEVAVGWWPGDERCPRAAFYGYAHPAPRGYQDARLEPPEARWEPALGAFVLDWEDVRGNEDPHRAAVSSGRSSATPAPRVTRSRPSPPASTASRPRHLTPLEWSRGTREQRHQGLGHRHRDPQAAPRHGR
jgi:hypothetical protein